MILKGKIKLKVIFWKTVLWHRQENRKFYAILLFYLTTGISRRTKKLNFTGKKLKNVAEINFEDFKYKRQHYADPWRKYLIKTFFVTKWGEIYINLINMGIALKIQHHKKNCKQLKNVSSRLLWTIKTMQINSMIGCFKENIFYLLLYKIIN